MFFYSSIDIFAFVTLFNLRFKLDFFKRPALFFSICYFFDCVDRIKNVTINFFNDDIFSLIKTVIININLNVYNKNI